MKNKATILKKFQKQIQPLWNELSLKIVSNDTNELDLKKFGELLNHLEKLKKALAQFELPVLIESCSLLRQILEKIITKRISYQAGMSHVTHFCEIQDDAIASFIGGEGHFPEFKEKLDQLSNIFTDTKVDLITKDNASQTSVIQELIPELLEDNLLTDFISEAEEGLEQTEADILELEKTPQNIELINPILRIVHTIKGTSGFLNLTVLGTVAHQTEDLLVKIRAGNCELTPTIFETLLKSIDVLKQLLFQLKEIIQNIETTPVNVQEAYDLLALSLKGSHKDNLPPESAPATPPTELDPATPPKRLGDILIEEGVATFDQIEKTITEREKPLGEALVDKGIVSQENVNNALKQQGKQGTTTKITDMVKVPADKLDELAELVGEMVVALSVLSQSQEILNITDRKIHSRLDQLDKVTESLRDHVLGIRMFPVGNVFSKLSRQVRDLSHKSRKKVNLSIKGANTLVDKMIIDTIYAPLMHLIRNAVDHGIEEVKERQKQGKDVEGKILLNAHHLGDSIVITIQDDGKGLQKDKILKKAQEKELVKGREKLTDQQIFAFIFHAGFSTAAQVTDVSGRGVGMDVVKRDIENLRGKISIQSVQGQGTTFTIKLPLSTSIIEGLIVRVGESRFIVPILDVNLTVTPQIGEIKGVQGQEDEMFILSGELVPIIRLYQFYNITPDITHPDKAIIIVVNHENKKYGLMVDDLLHRQQVVIKNLGERFDHLSGITGGTILGDGRVGLILEPEELINQYIFSDQVIDTSIPNFAM